MSGKYKRFLVPLAPGGAVKLPKHVIPVVTEIRGSFAEVLVTDRAAKYLRERRYAAELSLPREYLSVTQVEMYMRCPLQYYWRYVMGLKVPPRADLVYGRATHEMAETNYTQKIDTHSDLPVEAFKDAWHTSFAAQEAEIEWDAGEDPKAIHKEGLATAELFARHIAPEVQPTHVEQEYTLEFENTDFGLKGVIDVVDSQRRLRDTKTSGRTPDADTISNSLQMKTYPLGFQSAFGEAPSELVMDYVVRTKVQKYVRLTAAPPTLAATNRALKTIAHVGRAIRDGSFYPCAPGSWVCSPKWCGYWSLCHQDW